MNLTKSETATLKLMLKNDEPILVFNSGKYRPNGSLNIAFKTVRCATYEKFVSLGLVADEPSEHHRYYLTLTELGRETANNS